MSDRFNTSTIGFCCLPGLENFVSPIADSLKSKYTVLTSWEGTDLFTGMKRILNHADTLWFEWANDLAIEYLRPGYYPQIRNKRVIVRIHSYEILHGLIFKVNWEAVDDVIFVSEFMRGYTCARVKFPDKTRIHVIHNGIETHNLPKSDLWAEVENKRRQNPDYDPSMSKIAMLGHLSNKKGLMLLLHSYQQVMHLAGKDVFSEYKRGGPFKLHVGGAWQEDRYRVYSEVFLEEVLNKNAEMAYITGLKVTPRHFYKDKHFVICTSPWESQNLSVCEGMTMGLKPAIHWFPGAECIYPKKYLWKTIEELKNILLAERYEPEEYLNLVDQRFKHCHKIKMIIEMLKNKKTVIEPNWQELEKKFNEG